MRQHRLKQLLLFYRASGIPQLVKTIWENIGTYLLLWIMINLVSRFVTSSRFIVRILEPVRWFWWSGLNSALVNGVSIDRTTYTSSSHGTIGFCIGVDRVCDEVGTDLISKSTKNVRRQHWKFRRPVITYWWGASGVTKKSFCARDKEMKERVREVGRKKDGERGKDLTAVWNRFCLQTLACPQIKGHVWTSWISFDEIMGSTIIILTFNDYHEISAW